MRFGKFRHDYWDLLVGGQTTRHWVIRALCAFGSTVMIFGVQVGSAGAAVSCFLICLSGATWINVRMRLERRGKLIKPPGALLLQISEFLFSEKTFKMVLQPTLADMQEQYFKALCEGRPWKAHFVRLHGYCCFGAAVWGQLIITPLRAAQKIWTIAGGG